MCRCHVACHERERLLGHELLHEQAGEAEGGEYLASVARRKPARSPIYYVPADYEIDIPQVGVDEEEVKQLCYRVERVCKGQAEKEYKTVQKYRDPYYWAGFILLDAR